MAFSGEEFVIAERAVAASLLGTESADCECVRCKWLVLDFGSVARVIAEASTLSMMEAILQ